MAKIAKPNSAKKRKGSPPKEENASRNLTKPTNQELKPLNFKVPAEFRKQYKQYALDHDITMVELLLRSFEYYKSTE